VGGHHDHGQPGTNVALGFKISRTDNPAATASGSASAWMNPVLISKQSSTTFSDKPQIWADNAQSSPFFGHVYVCWASFRSNSHGQASPVPLIVARSADGGGTWVQQQVGPATSNGVNSQPDGCTVRTDSHGNLYVFGVGSRGGVSFETTRPRRSRPTAPTCTSPTTRSPLRTVVTPVPLGAWSA
jgi:hypothetical protein